MNALVHIVVLSWNRAATLLECLSHIARLDYPNYLVVVVDNGSSDDSVKQVRSTYPSCRLILNGSNLGYAGGANRGIEYSLAAGADYVWLLNDDTSVPRSTLTKLIVEAEQDPTIGALSPLIYYQNEPTRLQFAAGYVNVRSARLRNAKSIKEANHPSTWERQVLCGAAMLLRATAIRRVGLLNERLFAYWEDFDLSMRVLSAGMKTRVVCTAKIYHSETLPLVEGRTRAPYYYYLMTRNEFWFWRCHVEGAIRPMLRSLSCFGAAIAEAAVCRRRGFNACADACLDGAWSALLWTPGSYEERRQMPILMRRVFSIRPFLWSALLSGKWKLIIRRALRSP